MHEAKRASSLQCYALCGCPDASVCSQHLRRERQGDDHGWHWCTSSRGAPTPCTCTRCSLTSCSQEVCTDPEFRRRGIAGKLLDEAAAWMESHKMAVSALSAAKKAAKLYASKGWVSVPVTAAAVAVPLAAGASSATGDYTVRKARLVRNTAAAADGGDEDDGDDATALATIYASFSSQFTGAWGAASSVPWCLCLHVRTRPPGPIVRSVPYWRQWTAAEVSQLLAAEDRCGVCKAYCSSVSTCLPHQVSSHRRRLSQQQWRRGCLCRLQGHRGVRRGPRGRLWRHRRARRG